MRFIHFSDIHLDSRYDEIYGINTVENLRIAVRRMNMVEGVDFAVLSGDISNDGSPISYAKAGHILSGLSFPVYAVLGNHDDSASFKECMESAQTIRMERLLDVPEGPRFIFLNSVWPDEVSGNKSRGFLSDEELTFLDKTLKNGRESIIVMHHPCVPSGGWMDRRILVNKEDLMDVIKLHSNILAVLSGHNHSSFSCQLGDCFCSVAPATGTTYGRELKPYEEAFCPGFDVYDYCSGNLRKETVYLSI